jgi:hypothetical protein
MNMSSPPRTASEKDVHVSRGKRELWFVTAAAFSVPLGAYKLRDHAMAFARALAFSSHGEMIVHDIDGRRTRHSRSSLTYPVVLA